jgi:hypothetical protein
VADGITGVISWLVSGALHLRSNMEMPRTQLAIAGGTGALILLIFFASLVWLNHQGPVLSRSADKDTLSGIPNSIRLNPLRDRGSERVAGKFIRSMRDGQCREQLANWEKDYRKRYAAFICDSEAQHPLLSWEIAEWEDAAPLRILHYRGTRRNAPGDKATYQELFSVTLENKDGEWVVTKYDSLY